ncbi:MAG: chromate transporter [Kiritimatiellae bacterium]|nr:chromate transporter [Kiritimatiellia bacterium]MDD4737100.1 chromate transporter [Kiritimatiellia bacterium]
MQMLWQLFKSFALIGVGAYGGGMVTIPLIQHAIVNRHQWLAFDEMASLLAIAQMTPGPIAVNAATFTGFRIAGFAGAATATLAVVLPCILIMILVAPFMERISRNPHVRQIREGVQIGVLSLILYATWSYGSMAIHNLLELAIGLTAFLLLLLFEGRLHPVFVILAGGVAGLFLLG